MIDMKDVLLNTYRRLRVKIKQWRNIEPRVFVGQRVAQEFHGNEYCGWSIPVACLGPDSVVVDVGLGEDISFSTSLIDRYHCSVHAFDPTPRAIDYVEQLAYPNVCLHKFGLASIGGRASFYLPNNERYISGTLTRSSHTGLRQIEVDLITIDDVAKLIGSERIDLLKLDIEGAEYELLMDERFACRATQISILCVEFHHRWSCHGARATEQVVKRLSELGFYCIWANDKTNEEFTFVRDSSG
jgi:FkbM family methyltransferase